MGGLKPSVTSQRPRPSGWLAVLAIEADHLAVKSVKQSCLSSSAEALVRWGPRQDKKKRYQRCGHDDDRRTHSHTHTDGHIIGKQHQVLIMTSPMCHTIPGQHRQFAGRGVPQAALVRLILVVEVVLPAPERCDLESRSSLVKPAYSPSKTSPVLPGGRATTRAGCLVPIAVVVGYSQSSPAWCPAPSHAPWLLDRLMCLNVRAPIDDV
ncbi:hypothetical protein COCCADRAFT_31639 [Bipolaris zeicola 26-R-13]|uniref:Uncharacterized protein n=1 Tax=Cochliobolus carbonum (strain 26-R-13) TaxID=930089 RepID=W6YIV9_COCC2|nr:uncharacterized protein COCCADRAFT_31639 [Bipolaris zeicola 26-R-13]EUC39257.1 hypothetical protein COCCADRAFT_31639 [Bipolaris zeicola 26-R-13]